MTQGFVAGESVKFPHRARIRDNKDMAQGEIFSHSSTSDLLNQSHRHGQSLCFDIYPRGRSCLVSVDLSIHLPILPSSISPSAHPSTCLSAIHLSSLIHPTILSIPRIIYLSVCLFVYIPIYLSCTEHLLAQGEGNGGPSWCCVHPWGGSEKCFWKWGTTLVSGVLVLRNGIF